MKIDVYGYFGHGNLGDEALGHVWRKRLEGLGQVRLVAPPRLPGKGITVFTGEPLQDRTSRRSLLFYAAAIRIAARRGRAILAAIGVDVRTRVGMRLVRWAARGATYISVRDPRSGRTLRSVGVPAREARDPALLLEHPTGEGNGPVLLNLVPGLPREVADEARRFAIQAARSLGRELLGLAMDRYEDVRALAGVEAVSPHTVAEALAFVAGASLVIGARLHALEFALLCGVPFVAVPYAPKVEGFLELTERDLPAPVPRIPGFGAGDALPLLLSGEYREGLRRARDRLREEAAGGMDDVTRAIRELA